MPNKIEFLIENDILIRHLTQKEFSIPSTLEIAMLQGICFTTVINASELFFKASTKIELENVNAMLYALKILGIHQRYSLNISKFFNKVATTRDAIICSVALNNKLPILTDEVGRYKKSGIKIITSNELRG
jgi:predicted nucleic acid-binding protein